MAKISDQRCYEIVNGIAGIVGITPLELIVRALRHISAERCPHFYQDKNCTGKCFEHWLDYIRSESNDTTTI